MTYVFRAMNTDVTVLVPGHAAREAAVGRAVADRFAASEHRFSRFLADSEVTRLNDAGHAAPVSAELFEALVRARHYAALTDGLFDPCIGADLVAAGYDRSFVAGGLDRPRPARRIALRARASLADVALDAATASVTLPPGCRLDFGGMIKGWTVDQAAYLLPGPGAVDAGGDMVVRGAGLDGAGWLVDVEDPADPARTLLALRVTDRAVATSAPNRRQWQVGGQRRHHLIDPRSGLPALSDLAQVTVVAACAEWAEVLAKVVFLLGCEDGRTFLRRFPDVAAVFVDHGAEVEIVGHLEMEEVIDVA